MGRMSFLLLWECRTMNNPVKISYFILALFALCIITSRFAAITWPFLLVIIYYLMSCWWSISTNKIESLSDNKNSTYDHNDNCFDLIRLAAAMMVVVSHGEYPLLGITKEFFSTISTNQTLGGLGVSIFFVISGYLITESLSRSMNFKNYAISRGLRILPGLLGFVIVSTLFSILAQLSSSQPLNLDNKIIGYLLQVFVFPVNTCVSDFNFGGFAYGCGISGQNWTLTFETLLYICVYLCMLYTKKNGIVLGLPLLMIGYILSVNFNSYINSHPIYELVYNGVVFFKLPVSMGVSTIPLFFFGSLLSKFDKNILKNDLLLYMSIFAYITSFNTDRLIYISSEILFLPIIIISLGLRSSTLSRKVSLFGDLSYGIYLYHFLAMALTWYIYNGIVGSEILFVIYISLTVGFGFVSYFLIERPSIKYKNYILLNRLQCTQQKIL